MSWLVHKRVYPRPSHNRIHSPSHSWHSQSLNFMIKEGGKGGGGGGGYPSRITEKICNQSRFTLIKWQFDLEYFLEMECLFLSSMMSLAYNHLTNVSLPKWKCFSYQEMVYCSGSNLPIKSLTIGFCPPRHIGDFAEILSTVIGNFRSAKRVFLGGGGEVNCSWNSLFSLEYPCK